MTAGDEHSAEDRRLLVRAEEALTEIKVSAGLSEHHEAVLAALRIRLKGGAGSNLEDLLAASEDPKPSGLDDLLSRLEGPKRSLDDLFGSSGGEAEGPGA